ncbi:DUF724 domain-containing protein 7-like isoform X3 [Olea europaea var. sylvestris]|uniref:DUF724 domain-containing protein 7-like isoform X3 n=1 Tax=Olea europaea var. sylvestris TaxID=158386 RepID=UPI000C1D304C|nr:DUF724 domain-containing protein 7-like isoform X3 [Olea europaea var. sylvestris]
MGSLIESTAALMFEVGTEVEVLFDAEGCRDVWFPAIIFDKLRNGSFLVEYQSPKVGDEARPLKVTTDPLHIRPRPPLLKRKKFDLLEKVDATFDNGWWSGVITKVLEDSRYLVFFKQINRNREFHHLEIRPHLEWKDGKWITSSKDVSIPSSENGKQGSHICTNDTAVAVRSSGNGNDKCKEEMPCSLKSLGNRMEQSTHRNQETYHVINPLTKSRHLSPSGSFDTFSQPLKKLKEGKAAASSLATHQQTIFETSSKAVQDGSVSPTSGITVTSSVKPFVPQDLSSNNPYWGRSQRKQRKQKNLMSSSMKKSGRTQMPQIGIPELLVEGKELNLVENAANIQKASVNKGLGIVLGLECTELGSSRHKTGIITGIKTLESDGNESLKPVSVREHLSNDLAIQNIKESKQSGTEVNIQKRKRGRPRRILIKTPQTPVTGTAQRGDVLEDEMVTTYCPENEAGSHTSGEVEMSGMKGSVCNQEMTVQKDHENFINDLPKQKNMSVGMMKKTISEVPGEKVAGMSTIPNEKNSSKRGKRRSADQYIASQYQDASRERTMDSNGVVNEAKKIVAELPGSNLDNEPLSKWIEGTQTPTAFDGSVLPARTAEQCIQCCKKQNEIAVPSEQQSLPFVKNSILWKMIESMEVFHRIPQNPHFKPLESYKESSREGLAIGYMVNFSSVVDKALSLQFDDPKSIMDDILETLVDLDRHGFDVRAVHNRITSLGSVKECQEKFRGQLEKISSQIVEKTLEVNKVDEEIDEINQQIRNLHEELSVARSAKKKKNREVASLQTKLQEVKESISSVKDDFEGLAGAPFGKCLNLKTPICCKEHKSYH